MPINLNDPRARKTRKGLQDALLRLVMQDGYDAVTIAAIADEAQAARITFYRHYASKEELLDDCLTNLYLELAENTQRLNPVDFAQGRTPAQVLYEHIEANHALYRLLFNSRAGHGVIKRIRALMEMHIYALLLDFAQQPPVPLELVAAQTASAMLSLAVWWLDNDKPYPPRYMAAISVQMTLRGILPAIGRDDIQLPTPQLDLIAAGLPVAP